MVDARDCGTVWTAVQGSGLGSVREFGGYAIPIEQGDCVLGVGCIDIVHQGLGTVGHE